MGEDAIFALRVLAVLFVSLPEALNLCLASAIFVRSNWRLDECQCGIGVR